MWLLTGAAILAVLKLLAQINVVDVWGVSAISWWWVIGAFGATSLWFWWSDLSGRTSRKAMEEIDQRKQQRLDRKRELLGTKRKR